MIIYLIVDPELQSVAIESRGPNHARTVPEAFRQQQLRARVSFNFIQSETDQTGGFVESMFDSCRPEQLIISIL